MTSLATSSNSRSFYLALLIIMSALCTKTVEANPSSALTIQSAVDQALEKNPDVLKAREVVEQSHFDFSAAIGKALPTVAATFNASYQKDAADQQFPNFGGETYNQYTFGLTATQPLFDGGAVFAALRYGTKNKEITNYALQIVERTTTESVLESFYSLLLNERLLQVLNDTYAVDLEVLKIAERYFRVGRIQKVDLLNLKTQTSLLRPKIAQAEDLIQTTASQLAMLLRNLNASDVRAKGQLVSPDPTWVKQMLADKIAELPEILQSRTQVDQFEDNRTIQMATYWPKLNLVGQWGRLAYSKTDLLNSDATNWAIALQLSIPIFNGLTSIYTRQSLASQEKQMEMDETKTADTVSVSQIQTDKDLQVAETNLSATEEAAGFGRETFKQAEHDFKLSTINYIQYQTSLQAFLDSETGYYQAKYNYIVAVAKHFNAKGIPLSLLVAKLDQISGK